MTCGLTKVIPARYAGRCALCYDRIEVDELVVLDRKGNYGGRYAVSHIICFTEKRATEEKRIWTLGGYFQVSA
jgi:hypothetical protein